MSFEKRNYISEQTVITAKNLNDIQDELIRQAEENYTPIATATVPGKVMPSSDFDIAADGTLSLYKAMAVQSVTTNKSAAYEIGTEVEGLELILRDSFFDYYIMFVN